MSLQLCPVTLREANEFVADHRVDRDEKVPRLRWEAA